jgi:exosortase A
MSPAATAASVVAGWRVLLPGLLVLIGLLGLFRETAVAMVGIWSHSDTYAHAFLVPPIVVWMIWRRRSELADLPVQPAFVALPVVAALCLLWLLGDLAAMNSVTQFSLVAMIAVAVPVVFGWAVMLALLFPLLFLFFAVPLGEALTPMMMDATADFTVTALQLSGVPVYREGLQFIIPSGNWSVVSACSGVRYLIASFMVGTLFAYLNYQSTRRRVIFMALSVAVPVLANWLRAYMIVMLGHLSGNTLAVGVDHLIYGWVFFGVVIGLMFMIGARWSEPDAPMPVRAPGPIQPGTAHAPGRTWLAASGVLALAVATQALLWKLEQAPPPSPSPVRLPATLGGDWQALEEQLSPWVPAYKGARSTDVRAYRSANGLVGIWTGYYLGQDYEHKMVTSANFVVSPNDEGWGMVTGPSVAVALPGGPVVLKSAVVRASSGVGNSSVQRLLVWRVYWVGGLFTANDARAKLQLALNRLSGNGDASAVLMFYTPLGNDPAQAEAALRQLVTGSLTTLGGQLQAVTGPATATR